MGEQSDRGEGVDLRFHPLQGVVEPPTGTELDFAPDRSLLERSASGGENGIVPGIEIVNDGPGQLVDLA